MAYKIWNTALDHTKRFLHRRAAKMQMEPIVGGKRLRIRSSLVLDDAVFEHNKTNLELYKSWGVLDYEQVGGEKKVEKEPKKEKAPELKKEAAPAKPAEETKPESPPAETTPPSSEETKPQPKSPFKGKQK
jgi:hypothetical protein